MSDEYFDVENEFGLYPPKGWGWYTDEAKRRWLKRVVCSGALLGPTTILECKKLGVVFCTDSIVRCK